MRVSYIAAMAALTVTLAGCADRGGLRPQQSLTEPSSLHVTQSLAGVPQLADAWPATDWWTKLGDAQLDALIAEALQHNPGLAAVDARSRAAQAQVGLADAARKPTVNAGASVSGARIPATVLPMGGHFGAAKYAYASFKWGLDLWGGKRDAWQAAVGESRAAAVAAHAARIELSANVARAYAQLGAAFTQQDLAEDELKRADQALQLTRQRVAAGIDNRIQLQQGEAEVATAQQEQAAAAQMVVASRSALSALLGAGPDRGLRITRPHSLALARLTVPAALPLGLLGHRADLVAARWRVEAARKDIQAAKTEFLPNISLGALAGVIALGGGNPLELPARFYQVGPSLSLPVFDGGRLRANLSGKDAAFDLAVAQYNQKLVDAVNEVAVDYAGLQSLDAQIGAQRHARDAAQGAWELAEQRYKAGVGNFLEALTVRQQLLRAEQAMATLDAHKVDLSLQLVEALGGGFQPSAQAAAATPSEHS